MTEKTDSPKQKSARKPRAKHLPLWETEARSSPKLEARAHILEQAAIAFTERGFSGTTLDHVAQGLGTTKGQIYHYYRSKSDLYFDIAVGAHFMVNDSTEPWSKRLELAPPARLQAIARAHALVLMRTWVWQRVALEATQHQQIAGFSPREERALSRMSEFRDGHESRISSIITEGIEGGFFSSASPSYATKAVLGSLNWLTVWYDPRKSSGDAAQELIANRISSFVIAGLRQSDAPWRNAARQALAAGPPAAAGTK